MADFKQCVEWLKQGKKVRRPSWEKDSYWMLGIDESIQWVNRMHAHIHLNQIEATDFEIYKEEVIPKPIMDILKKKIDEATDEELEESQKILDKKIKELKKDNSCLSDKVIKTKEITKINPHEDLFNFGWVHDEEIKDCFEKIKGDFLKGMEYNWVEIENIINKRIGPELI